MVYYWSYFLLKLNPYQIQCMNNQYETFIQSLKIQKAKHPNTYNSGSQGEWDLNAFLNFSTNRGNQKLHFWRGWYKTVLSDVIISYFNDKSLNFCHNKIIPPKLKSLLGFYLDWLPFVLFLFLGVYANFFKSPTIRLKWNRINLFKFLP